MLMVWATIGRCYCHLCAIMHTQIKKSERTITCQWFMYTLDLESMRVRVKSSRGVPRDDGDFVTYQHPNTHTNNIQHKQHYNTHSGAARTQSLVRLEVAPGTGTALLLASAANASPSSAVAVRSVTLTRRVSAVLTHEGGWCCSTCLSFCSLSCSGSSSSSADSSNCDRAWRSVAVTSGVSTLNSIISLATYFSYTFLRKQYFHMNFFIFF